MKLRTRLQLSVTIVTATALLRSPLATLLGELQLALRRPRAADEYRRSLEAMHAEDCPHIFAPFYRGLKDAPEGLVGAGLGLSIARAIARGAGSELVLDESYLAGARFVVKLPLA